MGRKLFILLVVLIGSGLLAKGQCSSSPNVLIPEDSIDYAGISDVIPNTGSDGTLGAETILEEVCVLITHQRIHDLVIYLTSPFGTEIMIFDGSQITDYEAAVGDDLGNTYVGKKVCFTMDADKGNEDLYGSAIGNWLPLNSFDAFNGENPNGNWTLTVVDFGGMYPQWNSNPFADGQRTLDSWSIGFSNGDCESLIGLPDFPENVPDSVGFTGLQSEYCLTDVSDSLFGYPEPFFDTASVVVVGQGLDLVELTDTQSTININSFEPDDILTDPSHITVSIDIYHEWIGDLAFYLTAPCGETITLINRPGHPQSPVGAGAYVDGLYSFSDTASMAFPEISSINDTVPEGVYLPEGDFADLLGCQLQGDWTLSVFDFYEDSLVNETLFGWEIILQQNYNEEVSYSVFSGPGVVDHGDSLATATFYPDSAGVGTHEIIYSYLHFTGEEYTDTQLVVVYSIPLLVAPDTLDMCSTADTVDLQSVNPTDQNGLSGTYTWYYDNSLSMPIVPPIVYESGTYYVLFEGDGGACSDTSWVVFNYKKDYVASATGGGSYCVGDSIVLEASVDSLLPTSVVDYHWTGPNAYSSTESMPVLIAEEDLTGTYALTVYVDGCIQDSTFVEVEVFTKPTVEIIGDTLVCASNPYAMYSVDSLYLDSTYVNYHWNFVNGVAYMGGDNLENFIGMKWGNDGYIWLEVEDENGCIGTSDTIYVDYVALPEPDFGNITVIVCEGNDTVTYQLEQAYYEHEWLVENGDTIAGGGPNDDFITIAWDNPDSSASFTLIAFNDLGCSDTTQTTAYIYTNPEPVLEAFEDTVCFESVVTYSLTEEYQSYQWDIKGGTVLSGGELFDDSITVYWDTLGLGQIEVFLQTNSGLCNRSLTQEIWVQEGPSIEFEIATDTTCFNTSNVFYQVNGVFENYDWEVIGGTITEGGDGTDSIYVHWNDIADSTAQVLLTVIDAFACETTDSLPVYIYTDNNPSFSTSETIVCQYDTILYELNNLFDTYNWEVTGGIVLEDADSLDEVIQIVWTDTIGTNINVFMQDENACQDSIQLAVQVNALPNIEFDNPILNICPMLTATAYELNEVFAEHYFDVSGGTIVSPQNSASNVVEIIWNNVDSGYVYVEVVTADACTALDTLIVDIQESTPIAFIDSTSVVCSEAENVLYTLPDLSGTYTWTVENAQASTDTLNGNGVLVDWNDANGVDTYIYAVLTDNLGCLQFSDTIDVTINPLPNPDFMIYADTVCAGEQDVLYQLDTSIIYVSYDWIIDGGQPQSGGGKTDDYVIVNWGGMDEGQVEVTVEDENGCTQIEIYEVAILDTLSPKLVEPEVSLCAEEIVLYTLTEEYDNYVWNIIGGDTLDVTGQSVLIDWGADKSGTIQLTVTNDNGCESVLIKDVTLNSLPVSMFASAPTEVCTLNDTVLYQLKDTFVFHQWELINGTAVDGGDTLDNFVAVNWSLTDTVGAVVLFVEDVNGCSVTDTIEVSINPLPTLSFEDVPTYFCEGVPQTTYQLEQGYTTMQWIVEGGMPALGGGVTDDYITVSWDTTASEYSLQVIATNEAGCVDSIEVNIQNVLPIQVNLIDSLLICPGESVQLLASGASYYEWDNAGTLDNPTLASPTATPLESTLYTLIASDGIACSDTASVYVEVLPKLSIEVEQNLSLCQGEEIALSGIQANNYTSIYWAVNSEEGSIDDQFSLNPLFTPSEDFVGTAYLEVVAENSCGIVRDSVEVVVESTGLAIELAQSVYEICEGEAIMLDASSNMNSAQIQWFGGSNLFDNPNNLQTLYESKEGETGWFQLELEANTSCENTTQIVDVYVKPTIYLNAGLDQFIDYGEDAMLEVIGDPDEQYQWSPPYGLSCDDCPNPIAHPSETITYTVSSLSKCIEPTEVTVNVRNEKGAILPNAFSPNGDGMNDLFTPLGREFELIQFVVFNRYGQKVFVTDNLGDGWDGNFNGVPQPSGVYTYICEYLVPSENGREKLTKGNVTLIR